MFFADIPGTRVYETSYKAGIFGVASGTPSPQFNVYMPDDCTITKVIGVCSTNMAGAASTQFKLKAWRTSLIGTLVSKGVIGATNVAGGGQLAVSFNGLSITVPAGKIIGFAGHTLAAGTGGIGLKLFIHFNKGYNS